MGNLLYGTIVKLLGGFYYVDTQTDIIECRARGNFRARQIKPCVGDRVGVEPTDGGKGYITQVEERKNSLVRPPIANLDQLIIVTSVCDPVPNLQVLDKMIAIAEYKNISPVLVITKSDRGDTKPLEEIYGKAGFCVFTVCNPTGEGTQKVREILKGKISAFCGNSGVGKSSLLNEIDQRLSIPTAQTSQKLGRGRHTTRHCELYGVEAGGYIADTPGFSAVDMEKMEWILKDQLQYCFREFQPFLGKCKYTGCSHTKEQGCAVLEGLREGEIMPSRHASYTAMYEQAKNIKEWEL